jgi:hypothetical protein
MSRPHRQAAGARPDHPDTRASRHNLADAYLTAGDFGRALQLQLQTLTDIERILGPDHPSTLTARQVLANAYYSAGEFGQAILILD